MRTLFASDKPFADCRVERGLTERVACLMGGGRAWGGGGASSVHGGPSCAEFAGRARAERTLNMAAMVVTLEMSKLSGWLNAAALCRVEREAWDEEHIVGLQGTRGAHFKHAGRGCNFGRVEAQRLVERTRVLPSRKGSVGRMVACGAG